MIGVIARVIVFCLAVFALGACTGPRWGVHPDIATRAQSIHRIGVAPADVKIYQLSAGGMKELMDDWCATGKRNFSEAALANLKARSLQVVPVTVDKENEQELADVYALFDAIEISILYHATYKNENLFPEKINRFEYSVGPIDKLLKKSKADALLIANGYDEISTGGRKALMAVASIIPGVQGPHKGYTVISMALFDRSGALIWYDNLGSEGKCDLRDGEGVKQVLGYVLNSFPEEIR